MDLPPEIFIEGIKVPSDEKRITYFSEENYRNIR
ncbi:hypothetical protein CLS_13020 [[Clostridium] cf. saccharolyticum K10]|nr:hypothetical protein CLS_13020 [[Clostridium] cf. saccharolyticum K10]